jgi:hypothetical protein
MIDEYKPMSSEEIDLWIKKVQKEVNETLIRLLWRTNEDYSKDLQDCE